MKSNKHSALVLIGFLLASFTVAAIGGIATADNVRTWYPEINKPAWNPPAWIFGPVWTVLYVFMSVAAWRIWRVRKKSGARIALQLFFVQLVLNALWSLLFFGLHSPGGALVDIIVLWSLLAHLQTRFWWLDRLAGYLWTPYLAWVSFATFLNATIWWLNR